jgi:GNAT superfamily N-acetyltransferase
MPPSATLPPPTIRRATLENLIDLRHQVLREGLPREAAIFDGDRDPTSRHYGAFAPDAAGERVVACASMLLNQWLDEPAWQLRGMATTPDFRGKGLGRAIVAFIESDIRQAQSVRLLWCNARVPASRFYLKMGWQVVSEEFEIPTAGPHVRMVKRL